MDQTEIITLIILTITTVLMIFIGVQLISLIKELRKTIKKISHSLDDENFEKNNKKIHHKKNNHKKLLVINSILDKIKVLSPNLQNKSKKIFLKEKT